MASATASLKSISSNDNFHVTQPVDDFLRGRSLSMADVRTTLSGARFCIKRDDGTYSIGGVDIDGAPLSLVVSIVDGGGVLVVSEDVR